MSTRRQVFGGGGHNESTTSAPAKPPRGYPRVGPVKIEPLTRDVNNENNSKEPSSPACSVSNGKFSTTEKYTNMKNYFREMVQQKNGGEFSGLEAVNILDEYLQTNREQFTGHIVKRQNAIKVLEMWLRENVIRPTNSSCKDSPPPFSDSKKATYTMNPNEDHRLYICSTPTSYNGTLGRRPSRTSSFKRFFSPSRTKPADNASLCRSPSLRSERVRVTRRSSQSTQSRNLFTIDSRQPSTNIQSLEAKLHDAALFRLLTIVEIPMLDNLTCVPGQTTKSFSILSSILSKIGLGTTPETSVEKDDEMDDLLEGTPSVRPLLPWFQLARVCAPNLYFKGSGNGKPDRGEIHNWAKCAVKTVCDRYSTVTRRGSSPLFPTEFAPIIEAIVNQLLGKKKKKSKLALQYLCLMLPHQLRTHICNVVMFLERTMDTDEWMSLRDPFFLGKKGSNENFEIVFDELRPFIFPSSIDRYDQLELTEANAEVAKALRAIIDDVRITLAEKQKKCLLFKEHHPKIYKKYFSHLVWHRLCVEFDELCDIVPVRRFELLAIPLISFIAKFVADTLFMGVRGADLRDGTDTHPIWRLELGRANRSFHPSGVG
ncbi:unnamed protein product [Nippostrongylus brasiliensis]|uniref:DEP domain-containing protein n=1 Tax=Nippostrongylus brasiliensis TaxID=27835 RepID=A0A0N4XUF9_NIPBR|nr:unnamed protein product [Nippostrongylus brasiliensis]